jgi:hypothetical protein
VYLASFYWVSKTFSTVGYGELSGNTSEEYLFQVLMIFIGLGFFAWMLSKVTFILNQIDSISELKEEYTEKVDLFMNRLQNYVKLPMTKDYRFDIRQFSKERWNLNFAEICN